MRFCVELEDTDALSVIYGPRILVWTSRVFQRSLQAHGITIQQLIDENIHLPIFQSSCEIRLPLRLGDSIESKIELIDQRERSFSFRVCFLKEGALAARGEMVHVCIDATSREKLPLPAPIRSWLGALDTGG